MSLDLHCKFTDRPNSDDLDVVDSGLQLYNLAAADLSPVQPLGCCARTSGGEMVGGLGAPRPGTAER